MGLSSTVYLKSAGGSLPAGREYRHWIQAAKKRNRLLEQLMNRVRSGEL